jgi:hypothetical protein
MGENLSQLEIYNPNLDRATNAIFLFAFVYFIMTWNAYVIAGAVLLSFIHRISIIDRWDRSLSSILCFGFGNHWPWTSIKLAGKWIRFPFRSRATMLDRSLQLLIERSERDVFVPYSDRDRKLVSNSLFIMHGERKTQITSGRYSTITQDADRIIDFLGLSKDSLKLIFKKPHIKPIKHLIQNPSYRRFFNILVFVVLLSLCIVGALAFMG